MRTVALVSLLAGCSAEELAIAEMERGLQATNDALASALVAHELFRHLGPETGGARHGTAFGCPAQEQTGPDASHVLLLDYPTEGCVASSLLPPRISGHVWMDVTGQDGTLARVDAARVGGEPVFGSLDAAVRSDGDRMTLELDGPLDVGAVSTKLDLSLVVEDFGAVTLDGKVKTDGGTLRLDEVVVDPADLVGSCPVPSSGAATWSGERDVTLELGRARVPVTSGRFVGLGDLCLYAVPFWP